MPRIPPILFLCAPLAAAAVGAGATAEPEGATEAPVAAPEAAPEGTDVPLDSLMRVPAAAPKPPPENVEWAGERPPKEEEAAAKGPGRVRVDYQKESVLEDVPTRAKRERTDVGVAVRVDEADKVRVKSGVRVEEEKRSDPVSPEATPTVGVEVRF